MCVRRKSDTHVKNRDKLGKWVMAYSQLQLFPAITANARQSVWGQGVCKCCSQNCQQQAHAKIFQNYCEKCRRPPNRAKLGPPLPITIGDVRS